MPQGVQIRMNPLVCLPTSSFLDSFGKSGSGPVSADDSPCLPAPLKERKRALSVGLQLLSVEVGLWGGGQPLLGDVCGSCEQGHGQGSEGASKRSTPPRSPGDQAGLPLMLTDPCPVPFSGSPNLSL